MVVIVTQSVTCDDLLQTATAALAAVSTLAGNAPGSQGSSAKAAAKYANQGSSASSGGYSFSDFRNAAAGINRVNQCQNSAYFVVVTDSANQNGPMELKAESTVFSGYHTGNGVSEKYTNQDFDSSSPRLPVVQLEYQLGGDTAADTIFYDLSFIDCGKTSMTDDQDCVFNDGGYLITFDQDDDGVDCPHIYCPHADDPNQMCRSAYYQYNDDDTYSCKKQANFWDHYNMTITFCPSDEQLAPFGTESDSDDDDNENDLSEKHQN